MHKRLEKASAALRGLPEVARRIDELDAVVLQRGAEEKSIIVFPVLAGLLAEPIFLRFGELSSEPRSVEAILKQGLQPHGQADVSKLTGEAPRTESNASAGEPHESQSPPGAIWRSQVWAAQRAAGAVRALGDTCAMVLLETSRRRNFLPGGRLALSPHPAGLRHDYLLRPPLESFHRISSHQPPKASA